LENILKTAIFPKRSPMAPEIIKTGISIIPCGRIPRRKKSKDAFSSMIENKTPKINPLEKTTRKGIIPASTPRNITAESLVMLFSRINTNSSRDDISFAGINIDSKFFIISCVSRGKFCAKTYPRQKEKIKSNAENNKQDFISYRYRLMSLKEYIVKLLLAMRLL
jgi:hypothetical protein